MHKVHPLAWQADPTDFVTTHGMNCAAGWTRRGAKGARIVVCLLDREPVLNMMTDCDRYEPRDEAIHHHFHQMAKDTTKK